MGDFWNAPFGAARLVEELTDVAGVTDLAGVTAFSREGAALAARPRG